MKINEILKTKGLTATRYEKINSALIISTKEGKLVYKKNPLNYKIINYLKSRNFDYMPKLLSEENDDYQISTYVEGLDVPDEQKMVDLIHLTTLLHSKTTHYKEVDINEYESLYQDLNGNIEYLYNHYTNLITKIETKVYMSPSEFLLARNISLIFKTLDENKQRLEIWHEMVKEKRKMRNVVLHNNLKLEHFIRNEKSYLVSWDKAKIASPVFDIYKLYQNHALDFEFEELLKEYEKNYPLTKDEKELLYILISMPDIINYNEEEHEMCKKISAMLDKMYKTKKITSKEKLKDTQK